MTTTLKPTFAELRAVQCTAQFSLNDIPLARITGPEQTFFARSALPYLRNGRNVLELVVQPGLTPSTAKTGQKDLNLPGARAFTGVSVYEEGAFVGSDAGMRLCRIDWQYGVAKEKEYAPRITRTEFTYSHILGPWGWEQADLLDMQRDRREVDEQTALLHQAFAAGNPTPFLALGEKYFFPEMAQCHPGMLEADHKTGMAKDIQGNAARRGFVKPLDLRKADYRLCAEGRLVQLIASDWTPILDTLPQEDGELFPLPIFLGRVAKHWYIMRCI